MAQEDLGKIRVKPGRCRVAEWGTFEVIYTVGEKEIFPGGCIRFLPCNKWTFPQGENPEAPGFSRISYPSSIEGEVGFSHNSAWLKLRKGSLVKDDEIVFVYGDRSQDSPGVKVAPIPTENAPMAGEFEVGVSFGKDKDFTFFDPPVRAEIETGDATRFLVSVPSLISRGREAEVRIVAVDNFANPDVRFAGEVVIDDITLRFDPADKGRKRINRRFENEGVFILKADCKEKNLSGGSNPVEVTPASPEFGLYWGDIHVHSQLSDALGSPEGAYVYAREVAGLDFAAVTDHDWVLNITKRDPHHAIDEEGWRRLKKINDNFYEPGKFVTLLGYEWIREEEPGSNFGHMNIYYRKNDGPFFAPGKTRSDNPRQIAALLDKEEALLIPHQTLYSSPDLLQYPVKSEKMRLVEIYSGWGSSEAVDGRLINDHVRRGILKRERKGESVQQYLAFGYRFGFFSSSDDHLTSPGRMPGERVAYTPPTSHRGGLAAVYSKELTREAIFDALWERRVYAVTGARIILKFFVNGQFMGSEIKDSGSARKIRAAVIGQGPIERVDLVKNNRTIKVWEHPGSRGDFSFEDEKREQAVDYYYLRVIQEDGEMAWSSPVWVE